MSGHRSLWDRWRSGAPVAFALAQVVLLVVLPQDATLATVIVAEAVVALGLVLSLLGTARPVRAVIAFALLTTAGTGGVALALAGGSRLWLVGLVLVLAGATIAYGLHRYERVTLGLVTEAEG